MSTTTLPRLPKSSKRLLASLAEKGLMTQKELIQAVQLPAKTCRYAIKRLIENQLIVATPNLDDMRSQYYQLNPDYPFALMQEHLQEAKALVLKDKSRV